MTAENKRLPKVGDIVYWTGDGGPSCVLIKSIVGDIFPVYNVSYISGDFLEWTDWRLDENNMASWQILCTLPV